jgi:hypothetical protein
MQANADCRSEFEAHLDARLRISSVLVLEILAQVMTPEATIQQIRTDKILTFERRCNTGTLLREKRRNRGAT